MRPFSGVRAVGQNCIPADDFSVTLSLILVQRGSEIESVAKPDPSKLAFYGSSLASSPGFCVSNFEVRVKASQESVQLFIYNIALGPQVDDFNFCLEIVSSISRSYIIPLILLRIPLPLRI